MTYEQANRLVRKLRREGALAVIQIATWSRPGDCVNVVRDTPVTMYTVTIVRA